MLGRQSRYERALKPKPLALQDRDTAMIKACYKYRWLSREQLQRLFNFHCITRINIRLRKLYDNKYLSRRFLPASRGSSQAIYSLGIKGVDLVSELTGEAPKIIKQKRKENLEVKEIFLTHNLLVSDVRIAFWLAIKNHQDMKWLRWIDERELQIECRNKILQPDGYCQYFYQGKLFNFFLELDRSTESNPRFLNSKVALYLKLAKSGLYQKIFGVKYFRVLIITLTEERLYNLKTNIEKITDKIFWLTIIDKITPVNVFDKIWYRVGKEGFYSLLETK
ncbi:replication-relaxation family protein [candidate division WOR-3 bacterium]|nr:replication-relaxation family protein [candidate division WOR-3 bacterium]